MQRVNEGALTGTPYRRAIVKPLSPEEGLEIAELRLALISLAAKPAYPHLSLANFELAEKIARRMNRTQNPIEFFQEGVRFWHIIFEKAQRPIFLEVSEQLERRTTRYVPLLVHLFPDPGKRPRQREVFLSLYRKGKVTEFIILLLWPRYFGPNWRATSSSFGVDIPGKDRSTSRSLSM